MTPLLIAVGLTAPPAADRVEFNRDVRPILSDHCFACHGPDKNKRKAKLRLDDRTAAVAAGAIAPGKPADSELVARVMLKAGEDGVMPPPDAHKPLTARQKETLRRWVEQGAEYQPHWAYIVPKRPPVPAVGRDAERSGNLNPIDHFIRAELAKRNIAPSPEADRRTLIRRLSLDLVGLPPTPEQVEAFVNDTTDHAYESLVDALLASPHFGERMAVPWLDVVRFADTVGYHGDQNQRIFPYRDYVIRSFNANKPFDAFTREQLAGDLLPNPTTEQRVATGFNRLNMMTREGGAQPKEYLAKYQADRVRTVSMAWLGSTMGCAECHDHKYDPITAKDFYAMAAFFADVRQWGVYADYGYTPNPDLRGWTNDHPFPPEIEVESEYLKGRIDRLNRQLAALRPTASGPKYEAWKKEIGAFVRASPTGWLTPTPDAGKAATVGDDGRVVFAGKAAKGDARSITLAPGAGWVAAVKLELLPDPAHGGKLTRDGAATTTVQLTLARKGQDGKTAAVPLFYGDADRSEPLRYAGTAPVLGLLDGWRTSARHPDQPHAATYLLDTPIHLGDGEQLIVTLKSDNLGAARLSVSPLPYFDRETTALAGVLAALLKLPTCGPSGLDTYFQQAYSYATDHDPLSLALAKPVRRQIFDLRGGRAWTQVTVAQPPIVTRLLPRGNWMDETAPVVEPSVPGFLGGKPGDGRRLTRLDLADWITSRENPLTARVFVNRLWKQFFGTGLSAVLEDVGAQGEPPSHPELLDWLAVEFASDWDVKRMVKRIVMSATYRQASKGRPELREADPNNRLLAFMPPRRLEAEFVRDNALAAAGLLNLDVGGPSSKPYQPDGYYANLQFPDRKYVADADDRQYRRGLYTHWQRTFLHPMLANFDAPSREECTANRTVANTPQQALTLLNDPTFVEAARALGAKAAAAAKTDADRLDWLFRRAVARSPEPAERASLLAFLAGRRAHYAGHPDAAAKLLRTGNAPPPAGDPTDLAAWASVARVVLNLHETITRY
jgi:hypothetical protein